MRTAILTREPSTDDGTFGVLVLDDGQRLCSGELPWRNNAPGISCIPTGIYGCAWAFSPKLGRNCYHLRGVRNRDGILIHSANFVGNIAKGKKAEVAGCIALGMEIVTRDEQRALFRSRDALFQLHEWADEAPFELTIK